MYHQISPSSDCSTCICLFKDLGRPEPLNDLEKQTDINDFAM